MREFTDQVPARYWTTDVLEATFLAWVGGFLSSEGLRHGIQCTKGAPFLLIKEKIKEKISSF